MIRILGISGKRGSGKDSLYKFLDRTQCQWLPEGMRLVRVAFADRLKVIVHHAFGVPVDWLHGTDADKAKQLPNGVRGVSVRDALKAVGKAFTDLEPEHWVRHGLETVRMHHKCGDVLAVFTDVRFPAEVAAIQGGVWDGKVVRLTRNPYSDQHPSEVMLDGFTGFNETIDNTELGEFDVGLQVLGLFKQWGWAK